MGFINKKEQYVTHYDAWCAVQNVRTYYEDMLYRKGIKIEDSEADKYVEKQCDILREKAEGKRAPMYCAYCGGEMFMTFVPRERYTYGHISSGRYDERSERVCFQCGRCGSKTPEVVVGISVIDKDKVKDLIQENINICKDDINDEEDEFDDFDE